MTINRPTLLIIEDNTMIAEYLVGILEGAGYVPLQAATLAEARRQLASCDIDLCLCDRHLPDGDSVELLPAMAGLPAILLSASAADSPQQPLLDAGFVEVLAKPCEPERLCRVIARTLAAWPRASRDTAAATPGPSSAALTAAAGTDSHTFASNPGDPLPVLDDSAALRMCGADAEAMIALRRLLADELPPLRQAVAGLISAGPDQRRQLAGELHKLAASTAWCGATELGHYCRHLHEALNRTDQPVPDAANALLAALDRLARALPA